jgi:hypothetical protein
MARKTPILLLVFLMSQLIVVAQDVPVKGFDVFGTTRISIEQIKQRFGNDIERLVQAIAAHDDKTFIDLYSKVTLGIQAMGDFAYAEISPIIYFDKGNYCYVTIDIVEQRDKKRRLTFLPSPRKQFSDPDGLLAAWHQYEQTALTLVENDEVKTDRVRCPALHCIWGFDHPSLKSHEEIFQTKVPKNKETLKAILREDEKETHRARAALLLAHISDPQELVQALLPSMKDSSSFVRNSVLRVLSQIAKERRDVAIPVDPFLDALDLPSTIERSKALTTLDELATHDENKGTLIRRGGARLIQILKLLQPNNHDYAYTILKKISGKDFGERNYKAWQQWLERQRRHRPIDPRVRLSSMPAIANSERLIGLREQGW